MNRRELLLLAGSTLAWAREIAPAAIELPLYLPANGALLSAMALMVSLGAFPKKGWKVQAEKLRWIA